MQEPNTKEVTFGDESARLAEIAENYVANQRHCPSDQLDDVGVLLREIERLHADIRESIGVWSERYATVATENEQLCGLLKRAGLTLTLVESAFKDNSIREDIKTLFPEGFA